MMLQTTTTKSATTPTTTNHLLDIDWSASFSMFSPMPIVAAASSYHHQEDDATGATAAAEAALLPLFFPMMMQQQQQSQPTIAIVKEEDEAGNGGVNNKAAARKKSTRTNKRKCQAAAAAVGSSGGSSSEKKQKKTSDKHPHKKKKKKTTKPVAATSSEPLLRHADMPADSFMRREYEVFQDFFGDCDILETWTEPMVAIKKDDSDSEHSGRLLEFFMSNFVKNHGVVYYLLKRPPHQKEDVASSADDPLIGGGSVRRVPCDYFESFEDLEEHCKRTGRLESLSPDDYRRVNVQSEYAQMMRRHQKLGFDHCRRGEKVLFEYRGRDGLMRAFKTTFCQLIFFWWAGCLYLQEYWARHHPEIKECRQVGKDNGKIIKKKKKKSSNGEQQQQPPNDDDARSKRAILVTRGRRRAELALPMQMWDECDPAVCEVFLRESDDVMRAAPHFSYFNPVLQQQSLM